MSLFSYISFPRQVDTSCLQSKFDKSKAFTVAEIRGTELDNGNLDDFPDGALVYLGDIFTDFQGMSIFDNQDASFTDVFTNKFIYSFQATFELLDAEKYIEECMRIFHDDDIDNGDMSEADHMSFVYGMIQNNKDDVAICRKQLYELIQVNTYPNEIIEIYSEFVDHINFNLGPAKEKIILDLSQVLTSELLQTEDKIKIEIYHTE